MGPSYPSAMRDEGTAPSGYVQLLDGRKTTTPSTATKATATLQTNQSRCCKGEAVGVGVGAVEAEGVGAARTPP